MIRRIMDLILLNRLVNLLRRVRPCVRYIFALVQSVRSNNCRTRPFLVMICASLLPRWATYVNVIKYRRNVRMNPLKSSKILSIINTLMVLIKSRALRYVVLVIIIRRKITLKAVNTWPRKLDNTCRLRNSRRSRQKYAMRPRHRKMDNCLQKNSRKVTQVLVLKQKVARMVSPYKMENRIWIVRYALQVRRIRSNLVPSSRQRRVCLSRVRAVAIVIRIWRRFKHRKKNTLSTRRLVIPAVICRELTSYLTLPISVRTRVFLLLR